MLEYSLVPVIPLKNQTLTKQPKMYPFPTTPTRGYITETFSKNLKTSYDFDMREWRLELIRASPASGAVQKCRALKGAGGAEWLGPAWPGDSAATGTNWRHPLLPAWKCYFLSILKSCTILAPSITPCFLLRCSPPAHRAGLPYIQVRSLLTCHP